MCQALHGLHAAHELRGDDGCSLGLVHRDLSPHNLMVSFDGAVKVLDFGIAKARGQRTKTTVGLLKGKALYMSLEQALGHRLDRRSDLFSAGLVLYEAITGERLFKRGNELATLEAIVSDPAERHPKIPERLWAVIARVLSKNRAERPRTAEDLASELEAALPPAPAHAIANLARTRFNDTWRASIGWDAAASEPSESTRRPGDGTSKDG
jgi:serine/threonine-protein kinase